MTEGAARAVVERCVEVAGTPRRRSVLTAWGTPSRNCGVVALQKLLGSAALTTTPRCVDHLQIGELRQAVAPLPAGRHASDQASWPGGEADSDRLLAKRTGPGMARSRNLRGPALGLRGARLGGHVPLVWDRDLGGWRDLVVPTLRQTKRIGRVHG